MGFTRQREAQTTSQEERTACARQLGVVSMTTAQLESWGVAGYEAGKADTSQTEVNN